MAVLHAILRGDPEARGKKGLADVVAKHDSWLRGRKFLLVPYHMPDSQSLDSAILGGYVAHVTQAAPRYAAAGCLPRRRAASPTRANCGPRRATRSSSPSFPAATTSGGAGLGRRVAWTPRSPSRRAVKSAGGWSVTCWPARSTGTRGRCRADAESFITLDEGLSVISKHARDVLGYDAVVLLLDELVLWLAGVHRRPDKDQRRRRRRSPSWSSRPSTNGPPRSSASCLGSATCGTWSAGTLAGADDGQLCSTR